jgi:Fe2+ or Zn2+ uptake regulation protein
MSLFLHFVSKNILFEGNKQDLLKSNESEKIKSFEKSTHHKNLICNKENETRFTNVEVKIKLIKKKRNKFFISKVLLYFFDWSDSKNEESFAR